jgi:farnesyl-diphosphate farnesyltransferase
MDSTKKTALQILELTSKTFFIPITRAPSPAKEALISAYLGLRATDEVEDHPTFDRAVKAQILKNIAFTMMEIGPDSNLEDLQVDWLGKEE